jgi:beta-xylosidase
MYFPGMNGPAPGVGVATADKPTGPFRDVLHHALTTGGDDPTIFIDDDGTAVLCVNQNGPNCGILNDDMVSWKQQPSPVQGFNASVWQWFEAPWITKRNGVYFLSFMMKKVQCDHNITCLPDYSHYGFDIGYATATATPLGPYTW